MNRPDEAVVLWNLCFIAETEVNQAPPLTCPVILSDMKTSKGIHQEGSERERGGGGQWRRAN